MFRFLERFFHKPQCGRPAAHRPVWTRLHLEQLEGRLVPNASRVLDAAGNLTLFVVRTDGSLTRYDPSGATVLFANSVTWVQGYRDPTGQLGFNVVFDHSRWVAYDATGSHDMGSNPQSLASVSTAFDPSGQQVLDVVQFDPHVATSRWIQYDAAGAHPMDAGLTFPGSQEIARSASTAIDPAGRRFSEYVLDAVVFFPGGQNVHGRWYEFGPSGNASRGDGVLSVVPTLDATGALAYDVVHEGGVWVYYDAQGAHFMGINVA